MAEDALWAEPGDATVAPKQKHASDEAASSTNDQVEYRDKFSGS